MTAAVLFQNMPPLSPEEYAALEASILEHGIQSPVIVDDEGVIIDGHHRSKIASEHSLTVPKQIVYGKSEAEKRTLALSLNLDRRHLDRDQRRALIAESVKADPELSDREHARRTGVDHKTVAAVRAPLESSGEIPQSNTRVSADGRVRPATQPERPAEPDVPTFDPTPSWDPVDTETGEITPEPRPVTGLDGKTYTHPEPKETPGPTKRKRRPIHETARDAGMDLRDAVDRIARVFDDDRFDPKTNELAPQVRNQLAYAIETCQGLTDRIPPKE